MRILVLSNLCPPHYLGGYELACFNVAQELHRRGHEVVLLTTPSHVLGEPDPSFVQRRLSMNWFAPYHTIPQGSALQLALHEATCSDFRNTAALIETLRTFKPDVVYCWNLLGLGGLAILDILNVVGAPRVTHVMDVVHRFYESPNRIQQIFAASGRIRVNEKTIIVSQQLLDEILDLTDTKLENVSMIPCWANPAPRAEKREYRVGGITKFVAAGGINSAKGMDLIVEASADLLKRGVSNFSVDVFGSGEIGTYVSMAKRFGVADHISFLGPKAQSELLERYSQYDLFLFPTWDREPFGFAPLEAAASGCVPIINRNCGAAERLVDRVHCLKIDRTAADLGKAMQAAIDGTVNLAPIGRAVSELMRTDLSFGRCMDQIEGILAGMEQTWDERQLYDQRLMLLAHTKHHLARSLRLGLAT